LFAVPPLPPEALIVTKQIPDGTVVELAPGVALVNSVVVAAPAGPEPATSVTAPSNAVVAAPSPAPATRSRIR
jgi:hypothetical protein